MSNYISENLDFNDDDEKKKITPKLIYDQIVSLEKGKLLFRFAIGLLVLMFCGIFALFFYNTNLFNETWTKVGKIVTLNIPILYPLWSIYRYFRAIKGVGNGDYKVITDKVNRVVCDDELILTRRRARMEHAMYLEHCGRTIITLEECDTYIPGDALYVVVRKKYPKDAVLVYNSKYYELEDISVEI